MLATEQWHLNHLSVNYRKRVVKVSGKNMLVMDMDTELLSDCFWNPFLPSFNHPTLGIFYNTWIASLPISAIDWMLWCSPTLCRISLPHRGGRVMCCNRWLHFRIERTWLLENLPWLRYQEEVQKYLLSANERSVWLFQAARYQSLQTRAATSTYEIQQQGGLIGVLHQE